MTVKECRPIEVSRRIAAPAGEIFQILTTPARQVDIDGSEMVQGAVSTAAVTGVGDVFVMAMRSLKFGDYEINNHVVEYDAVFNPTVAIAARAGLSVWGSRVLEVRGRTSGEWRATPVNLLTVDGTRYLVAPRGVTQWVRNLRVSGDGRLRLGRRVELFTANEIADDVKVEILRAYLRRWKAEVGVFFNGVSATSTDDEIRAIAPNHPVFRVMTRS